MYLLLDFAWHIPPLISFSTINSLSVSVWRSSFTLVFLRLLALLILVQEESNLGQVHIFKDTYFERFQVHQLIIMCCFEHTFFSKFFQTLFACVYSASAIPSMLRWLQKSSFSGNEVFWNNKKNLLK